MRVKIEIPRGSNVKYEFNKITGQIEVDRVLKTSYPHNYGFVVGTLWDDGDALDAFVVGDFVLHPGVEIEVEAIAIVRMDDNGESDDKLVCVLPGIEWTQSAIVEFVSSVREFLLSYKPGVVVKEISLDAEEIKTAYQRGLDAFIS